MSPARDAGIQVAIDPNWLKKKRGEEGAGQGRAFFFFLDLYILLLLRPEWTDILLVSQML